MIAPEFALVVGIVLTSLAFAVQRGATALTWSFVVGLLLLPAGSAINFQELPPIDKMRAIWLGALLGTVLFKPGALLRIRWHPADALLLLVVLLSGYSSVANGLGYWDALSAGGSVILSLGLPYILARAHFREARDLVSFGKGLFWGAVLYVPAAVWEFRMSPQLHAIVYGYFPYDAWIQQTRWGWVRPVVFLGHGLAVGAFFSACLLIGIVLLRERALPWPLSSLGSLAVGWVGLGLMVTMSFGPWVSALVGCVLLKAASRWRRAPMALCFIGLLWLVTVFTSGSNWNWLTGPARAIGATNRAASLQYRLDAMSEYAVIIGERPWFGHGGWGRGRTHRSTDSHALIYMLSNGFIGAGARYTWMFWMLFAAIRAAGGRRAPAERQVILLYACLMSIEITGNIFGVATVLIPMALISGAVTGLAAADGGDPVSARPRATMGARAVFSHTRPQRLRNQGRVLT